MSPRWTDSTGKHGIPRSDAVHSVLNATYSAVLPDEVDEGRIVLYVGLSHAQALEDDELEVLVHEFPGTTREAVIFHVMPLGPKYRRYREENPHE